MLHHRPHARAVVDADRREGPAAAAHGAVPEPDDANVRAAQVLDEPPLAAEVAEQHDRVALARLEDGGQRERLVGLGPGVPEDDRVVALLGLDRERLDRRREEGVGDVAHDGAEQHRRRAAQRPRDRVRAVAERGGDGAHALARLR